MRKGIRKNYHKQFRRIIREANHMLAKDELFLGRFEVFIMRQSFWKFDDNSGGELTNIVRCYDKATGYYADYRVSYAPDMNCLLASLILTLALNFSLGSMLLGHAKSSAIRAFELSALFGAKTTTLFFASIE